MLSAKIMGTRAGGAAVLLGQELRVLMVRRLQLSSCFSARRVEEDFILNAIDLFHCDNLISMQVTYGGCLA